MHRPNADLLIDELPEPALRALLKKYVYEVSERETRIAAMRFSVEDAYRRGDIPAGAIIEADAEWKREQAEKLERRLAGATVAEVSR